MTSSSMTFEEMESFVKKVERVKQEEYAKMVEKKAYNAGNSSGSYSRGHNSQAYCSYHIQLAFPIQ